MPRHPITRPDTSAPGRIRRLRRAWWLLTGVALIAFGIYEVVVHDLGAAPLLFFAVLPDLAFVVGIGQPHGRGQLPPRAVPAYNLLHRLVIPLALIVVALVALLVIRLAIHDPVRFEATRHLPLLVYVAGVAWLAHIGLDRAFGFGLRNPDGWPRDRRTRGRTTPEHERE
jgi:hypothetical protein